MTDASSALRRYSASASGVPKRRPGAASGPWWQSTQCASATRRSGARPPACALEDPLAEHEVPEQAALVGEADLRAERELLRLADVVHERRGEQQVAVQPRVQLRGLEGERRHRHGVLEQPAEVGVVPGARARRPPPLRTELAVTPQRGQQRTERRVVHLAGEVLEEALELVEVAVGDGEEGRRVGRLGAPDVAHVDLELVAEALDPPAHLHEVAALEAPGQQIGVAERARGQRA